MLGFAYERERGARRPIGLEDVDLVADLAGLRRSKLLGAAPTAGSIRRLLERDVRARTRSIALRQPDVVRVRWNPCRCGRRRSRRGGRPATKGPGLRDAAGRQQSAGRRGRRRGRTEQQGGDDGARGRGARRRRRTVSESIAHWRQSTGRARAYLITLPSLDVRSARRARRALAWVWATVVFLVAGAAPLWGPPAGIVVQGALLGGLTALLALGLALVYRANRILNFAQGDLGAAPASLAVLLVVTQRRQLVGRVRRRASPPRWCWARSSSWS